MGTNRMFCDSSMENMPKRKLDRPRFVFPFKIKSKKKGMLLRTSVEYVEKAEPEENRQDSLGKREENSYEQERIVNML